MRSVSLHSGEEHLLPRSQSLPVAPMNDGFTGDIISDVIGIEEAALQMRLSQERRNIRSLHEPIVRRRAQKLGATSVVDKRSDSLIPWNGFRHGPESKQMFVQGLVVLDMPNHDWRHVRYRSSEENRRARNPRNLASFERTHEFADRNSPSAENFCDRRRSSMPNPHEAIDEARQKQWNIAAVRNLREVCEKKTRVNTEKGSRDRSTCEENSTPKPHASQ